MRRPHVERQNALGQPIGAEVADWQTRPRPPGTEMLGPRCRLEPLEATKHAAGLHAAHMEDRDGRNWTYLPYGPFASEADYAAWVASVQYGEDPVFYAIVDRASERPVGVASYLRIVPEMGVIEVGHLAYSPALQRTPVSTEAMYLMMRRAFEELGYRRYEWKCDAFNEPSRNAALRLGFRYEGTFRNAVVMKGRNRDNAWFSITAEEWPARRAALERWLDPANFADSGAQRTRLSELNAGAHG
jgi:RimJ/RimL family protein N-acetyltransferase